MLLYNVKIALKSLRRNPVLTALLISAIALGICVSTTFIALRHVFEKDPLPGRSGQVFNVRLDNWDPQRAYNAEDPNSLPSMISYRDMRALMKSDIPTRQTGTFRASYFIHPDPKAGRPYAEDIRLVFTDFFTMFAVPFQYGGPWDKAADSKPEQVIVIDHATNEKLFGGTNSVGKTVRMEDRNYKVVGVIAPWNPPVRFYDLTQGLGPRVEPIYMPFNFTEPLEIYTNGNSDGWKGFDGDGHAAYINSESVWIQFWAELPTPEKQQAYREFVNNYVRDQKKLGRFQRPLHTEVTSLPDLMNELQIVPPAIRSLSIVSMLFLVVCSLNLVGLLLGKFLARVPEVSVRRALGASRWQVFWQHVVECELVGIAGGIIGMLLSIGMLSMIAKFAPNPEVVRLDPEMVLVSLFLSLGAGLLAGIYPSWRVCSVAPAMQLKVQ
ncbi:MAG TPA: FtsX-like permease family protein [Thermoanaerobaculia bacterium]|nr:FtsX-like permease family protein [Thermoanaerobaculia bacterium]